MVTVTDYQVLFTTKSGKPKKLEQGDVLTLAPTLGANFVEGTNKARPVVMFLAKGEAGCQLEVVAGATGSEVGKFSFTLEDPHLRTLHCTVNAKALKAGGFKIRCTRETAAVAQVVLMYQVKVGG